MASFFFLTKTPSKAKVTEKGYFLLSKQIYNGTSLISWKNNRILILLKNPIQFF